MLDFLPGFQKEIIARYVIVCTLARSLCPVVMMIMINIAACVVTTNVKPAEQACVEAVVRQNVNHVTGPVARNAHLSIFVGSLTNFNAINAMMDRSMIWLTAKSVGNAIASNVSLLNAMEWTAVIPARAVPAYSQKSSGGHPK